MEYVTLTRGGYNMLVFEKVREKHLVSYSHAASPVTQSYKLTMNYKLTVN